MVVKEKISASETLEILNHQWLDTKDIQKLACVGIDKARCIKDAIRKQILDEGKFLPPKLVPVDRVISYLNINISYLKKLAKTKE